MRREIIAIILFVTLAGAGAIRSQAPKEKSTVEILQSMKKANDEMIEKQQKTLESLDKMEETAKQLKIFGKRA